MGRKDRVTFSIGEDYINLVDEIAETTRRKKSDVARLALDLLAKQLGLAPVNELPKASTPAGQRA
ncbi:MAG: hypothetical protein AAF702_44660 [Chloroflexota bacterium]